MLQYVLNANLFSDVHMLERFKKQFAIIKKLSIGKSKSSESWLPATEVISKED